ncbi:CPBP family intramembrane glutamic endopeptidase [Occallatibacter riparius]|uniref:CPBP family glutamic-type intramembrane protease n=1 Tax=Occallatibacter riparius TaxID=1002689 RepID=A0A9J7BS81_9BACT|nr:CPBP family glutamic-type intramembrane protease [Occallatibacter riparius]UWZ83901.1 CPBP family glutamic-type intramembrane protease [Occallatibacter riparius]
MEPESPTSVPVSPSNEITPVEGAVMTAPPDHDLRWVFFGPDGLRAGWSVVIFVSLIVMLGAVASAIARAIHPPSHSHEFSPASGLISEFMSVVVLILAAWIVSLIEKRKLLDYNLRGVRRGFYFATGLMCGFAALSALVGGLAAGGWLHFGPVALSGGQILVYAALWGATFLLVGCFEEGTMRCYLLYTFTRGINFQWAAGLVGCVSGLLLWKVHGEGAWGAYMLALGGLLPCFWLQMKKAPSAGFWNAAWVTSFLFGAGHTGNNGENWIGIFAAGAIGFVFCVSVYVTGSAWWAIGCHAAWDWGETYFYGTADSGMVAKGHLLTATPAGPAFWSGGADGPEGSVLVLGVILLMLLAILGLYGRGRRSEVAAVQTAG